MEGNEANKSLKNVDVLENLCRSREEKKVVMPFAKCFRTFKVAMDLLCQPTPELNRVLDAIDDFRES